MPLGGMGTALAIGGIQGLAGLFGGRPEKTTVSGTQDSATTNNYTPDQQRLIQQLMQQHQQMLNGANLDGYQSQGLQDINRTGDAQQTAIQNMLAQRGLSYSPAAATAQIQQRVGQAGQQSQFLNSIPLLQYQLKSQALAGADAFSNAQRVNTSTHATSSGTQIGSGNMLGGLFAGIGSGLAGTLGKKFAQQGSPSNSSSYGGIS